MKLNSYLAKSSFIFCFYLFMLNQACATTEPWFAEFEVGGSNNSNVYLTSDEQILDDDFDESTEDDSSDFMTYYSAFGSYEFFDGENSDAKIFFDGYHESYTNSNISNSTFSLAAPYTYYLNHFRLRYTPAILNYRADSQTALRYNMHQADVARKFGRHMLGFSIRSLNKIAESVNYLAYDGHGMDHYFYWTSRWLDKRLNLKFGFKDNDYQQTFEGDESNSAWYLSAQYTYYGNDNKGRLYTRIKQTDYVKDPFDGFNRSDWQYRAQYTHEFNMSHSLRIYLRTAFTLNESNLDATIDPEDSKDYNQWVNSIGLLYAF